MSIEKKETAWYDLSGAWDSTCDLVASPKVAAAAGVALYVGGSTVLGATLVVAAVKATSVATVVLAGTATLAGAGLVMYSVFRPQPIVMGPVSEAELKAAQ